jgi:RNA polymerase sigma factor (sigma-70 family)
MATGRYDDSVRIYLRQATKFKTPSREEEVELIKQYQAGSIEAYHKLINGHSRFVYTIANRYGSSSVSLSDLIQEGHIGLIEALSRYKLESNCRLLTLAVWYIKENVRQCVMRHHSMVKNLSQDMRIQLFYKEKTQKNTMKIDRSLDIKVGTSKETYLDYLESKCDSPESQYATAEGKEQLKDIIDAALSKLNEQEQYVIRARILGEDTRTLQDIGNEMKRTRERVRQVEEKALRKLKNIIKEDESDLYEMVA